VKHWIYTLTFLACIHTGTISYAQCSLCSGIKRDHNETLQEANQILNTILNSQFFNKIHTGNSVCVLENEILTSKTGLTLKKGNVPVTYCKNTKRKKCKECIVVGDYTPTSSSCRVQIDYKALLLNFSLKKINGNWEIAESLVMEND